MVALADIEALADKAQRCPFLPTLEEPEKLEVFRDHALSQIHSIEDLEDLGREMKTCPYYGSRKAIKQAHLVTLPYNLILLKQARESLGISLEGWDRYCTCKRTSTTWPDECLSSSNVVIVDEAHNLIE